MIIDDVTTYMLATAAVFGSIGLFIAFMAHREWLREAAEEADRTAAE